MDLQNSYLAIQERIRKACQDCGRSPDSVKLIVASKTQSAERVAELHALGQKSFGENYAQELFAKASSLPTSIEWSFIGQLQSNKIKRIMSFAHEIQTLASLKHAQQIARYAEELGKKPYPVFIEVQVPGDESKGGLQFGELIALANTIQENYVQEIRLQGVMAIPPLRFAEHWDEEGEELYRELRQLANFIGEGKLSLGMSSDLEHAIRCGTDVIRIGSAVMGSRTKKRD